jgi:hypothetical protein
MQDKIADSILGTLDRQQMDVLNEHIDTCPECSQYTDVLKHENSILMQFGQKLDESMPARQEKLIEYLNSCARAERSKYDKLFLIRRTIMKSRMAKLTAAAVITLAMVVCIDRFGGSVGTASVAWGKVVENVEQVRSSVYRTKTTILGLPYVNRGAMRQTEGLAYYSSEHGMRIDRYENAKLIEVKHWVPAENAIISIFPPKKRYQRNVFSQQEFTRRHRKRNWKEFIKHFMSFEHSKLGRRIINGVELEGAEVNDPKVMLDNAYESVVVRLWVDVQTNLPARVEMKGTAGGGAIKCEQVVDVVELNTELAASEFEPNIPQDYTLCKEVQVEDEDEGRAIRGLRLFAQVTGGQYPSSLALLTAVSELYAARSLEKLRTLGKEEKEEAMSIHSTCAFYAALDRAGKDVAYYGGEVTADDVDAVLIRWKNSDNEYRVIFGDLTAENVTAKVLAELEPAQSE